LSLLIRSFRSADTQAVYEGRPCRRLASIRSVLERKLAMLDPSGPEDVETVDYH
jgi:hypothetical protein